MHGYKQAHARSEPAIMHADYALPTSPTHNSKLISGRLSWETSELQSFLKVNCVNTDHRYRYCIFLTAKTLPSLYEANRTYGDNAGTGIRVCLAVWSMLL